MTRQNTTPIDIQSSYYFCLSVNTCRNWTGYAFIQIGEAILWGKARIHKLHTTQTEICRPNACRIFSCSWLQGWHLVELFLQDFSTRLELQGSGKDSMKMDSYRGITLTSMVAKVLEFLILGRMDVLLLEAGIPSSLEPDCLQEEDFLCWCNLCHSWSDIQVVYVNTGSSVLMCLYDLQIGSST